MLRAFWSMISKNPRFRPNSVKIFRVPPLHIFYPWVPPFSVNFFPLTFSFWSPVGPLFAQSRVPFFEYFGPPFKMGIVYLTLPLNVHSSVSSLFCQLPGLEPNKGHTTVGTEGMMTINSVLIICISIFNNMYRCHCFKVQVIAYPCGLITSFGKCNF